MRPGRIRRSPQYDTWVVPGPAGGSPRKLLGGIGSVQWSPDGKLLTYTLAGGTAATGSACRRATARVRAMLVAREGGRHIHWPAWSRDGKLHLLHLHLRRLARRASGDLSRVPSAGGSPEPVVESARRAIYPAPLPVEAVCCLPAIRSSLDLGLWWQAQPGTEPVALTNGIGEHVEPRVSADGKRLVTALLDVQQSLVSIPVGARPPKTVR